MIVVLTSTCFTAGVHAAELERLRVNLWQAPQTFDPVYTTTVSEIQTMTLLFEGLVDDDGTGRIVPAEAERWEVSSDGKRYTFYLRPELRWSDGKPVRATDYVLGFRRIVMPGLDKAPRPQYLVEAIKNATQIARGELGIDALGVRALDDSTLVIELESAASYFLAVLVYSGLAPIPSHVHAEVGEAWSSQKTLVSNGAYVLADASSNHLALEKNAAYFGDASHEPQHIDLRVFGNPAEVMRSILDGRLDVADQIRRGQGAWVEATFAERSVIQSDESTIYGVFNMLDPTLASARVREALTLAIDRDFVRRRLKLPADSLARGFAAPPVWTGFPGFAPSWTTRTPVENRERARSLLHEAGYSHENPLQIEIKTLAHSARDQIAAAVRSMWGAIGVEARTVLVPTGRQFSKDLRANDYQFGISDWYADYRDPLTFYGILRSGGPKNHADWVNPSYDGLLDRTLTMGHSAERNQLFLQMEQLLNQDFPIVPIIHPERVVILSNRILDLRRQGLLPKAVRQILRLGR